MAHYLFPVFLLLPFGILAPLNVVTFLPPPRLTTCLFGVLGFGFGAGLDTGLLAGLRGDTVAFGF
jgi:hypothetical protein